jgi:CRISPR-associated endonuclease Csn1
LRVFGLDGGIASIGWAVIDIDDAPATGSNGRIVACGSRCFDAPETAKERTPTNAVRRLHRGQRRVVRRRRQRMNAVRRVLTEHGLLADAKPDTLGRLGLDPWKLRASGLERMLTPAEFAAVLGHIARHRGFRSNSKRDRGANSMSDTSKMLKMMEATRERLAGWQTVGLMLANDPAFCGRKRNRNGDYSRTILRADLEHEVAVLFSAQRRFGNGLATEALETAFETIAFSQKPLQDSEHLVGKCPFEPTQMRAAKRSYAFELFRLLSRLNALTIVTGGIERRLTTEEIRLVSEDFGRQKKISYKSLRRLLDLDTKTRFAGVGPDDEGLDVVARSGNAAEGTATLRNVLGDGPWRVLLHTPERLDRIAEVLTFRDALDSIRAGLDEAGVESVIADKIMEGVEAGRFAAFNGAGHISARAARAIIPHLAHGLVYSVACAEAGYDHAARPATELVDVKNPVARKALGEMLKQVRVLVQMFGLPDRMHVELARDVGKSTEERDEITRGIEKRNREKDRVRERLRDLLGSEQLGAEDILRFELWEEQNGRCLYSDEAIPPDAILATNNFAQVDHILPWSRFGDDSFANKTLCLARANQQKKGRTPFEWFNEGRTPEEWDAFAARVETCLRMKSRKKRGFYLRRNAAEVEERFRNRNLGDTRYATRLLLDALARLYPADGRRHVLARSGALTAKLRRAWGLEAIKKNENGERKDDRHHALDAIVIAATGEAMVQRLTRAFQEAERRGLARDFGHVEEPWDGFRAQAAAAVEAVFVSRSERRRARGEAHAATIRQVKVRAGKPVVFERKEVSKLTLTDLDRVKDAERNAPLIASLQAWIEAGKPQDAPPLSPKGDEVRKVRLTTKEKFAVAVRDGTANRGEMARVDVFREMDARGRARFHLVPIYPHQVADRINFPVPPNQAVVANKEEEEWDEIRPDFDFLFSLYPNSLVAVTKRDGEVIRGYFRGLDRHTGAIAVSAQHSSQELRAGIGAKTLLSFRKLTVDRLGRVFEVPQEVRTWHGAVCT